MAFKLPKQIHAKHREFPKGYWEGRKSQEYAEDSHGKLRFWKASRVGTENALGVTRITHTEGRWVQYRSEKPAQVLRVEPKGVWLQEWDVKGDKGIIDPETKSKIFFVPAKEYDKHVESYTFPTPISPFGLYGFGYIEV